jgi:hypothetical protein
MLLCGAWLGFAWSKPRFASLVIRTFLISLLVVGGYAIGTHPNAPGTKAEYQQLFSLTVRAVVLIWYGGWIVGSALREMTITLFVSEARRAAFEQGWAYRFWSQKIRFWWRLGVDREDREKATDFDLHMANLIKSVFTVTGIMALIGIMAGMIGLYFSLPFFRILNRVAELLPLGKSETPHLPLEKPSAS